MKRLIDVEHLKDRIITIHSGDWYDIENVVAMIDSEPTEERSGMIAFVPVLVFVIVAILVWKAL